MGGSAQALGVSIGMTGTVIASIAKGKEAGRIIAVSFVFSIGTICVIFSPMLDQLMQVLMDLFDSLSKQLISYEHAKQELKMIFDAYEIEIDSLSLPPQIEPGFLGLSKKAIESLG